MFQYTTTVLKCNSFARKTTSDSEAETVFVRVFADKASFMMLTWRGLDKDWDSFFQELNQENREKLLTYVLDH